MNISAYRLVSEGWKTSIENFGTLFKCAFLPILITFALFICVPQIGFDPHQALLVDEVVNMIIGISFMSCWYSFIITDKDTRGVVAFKFGANEVKMLMWYFLLVFAPYLLINFHTLDVYGHRHFVQMTYRELHYMFGSSGFWMPFLLAFFAVVVRLVLIFPALSVGENGTPSHSWSLTSGHWWVLIKAYVLMMFFATMLSFGLMAVLDMLLKVWMIISDHVVFLSFLSPNHLRGAISGYVFHFFGLIFGYFLWGWALTIPGLFYKKMR